jgi:ornithine cyclodeaminase/alanine dehydrogenase-like protein (mu-crystallin family)
VEVALKEHASKRTVMPPKVELSASAPWFLHAMPAIVTSLGAGVKWVSYNPTNQARRLPNSSALLILNDAASGLPYCVLDALWATYMRTAACAIVAIRHLANPDPDTITLIGAGQMADTIVPVLDEAFPTLETFLVLTRSAGTATAFCERMATRIRAGIRPARDADDATATANVVISAIGETTSAPLGEAQLRSGVLALPLDGENAWTTGALHLADKLFADDPASFLNGFRSRRPRDEPPTVTAGLADVVAGKAIGREQQDERIVCSNNGIAILDVALGVELCRRAAAREIGFSFELENA